MENQNLQETKQKEKRPKNKGLKILAKIFLFVVIAISAVIIFFNVSHSYYLVKGPSMTPTLNQGVIERETAKDGVFVSKIKSYTRGDIIVINKNHGEDGLTELYVIKRLIAIAGDKIKIDLIDGNYRIVLIKSGQSVMTVLNEPYLNGDYSTNADLYEKFNLMITEQNYTLDSKGFLTIEPGNIFYLGDNRAKGCLDCSTYGQKPKSAVVGKVDYIAYDNKNIYVQVIKQFFGWRK